MARTALGWTVKQLAENARVSTNTVVRLERGEELKPRTVADMQQAFEGAGVIFINDDYSGSGGPGVRLRKTNP
jgi:transcriptional regulator with XRE-family HTH domain